MIRQLTRICAFFVGAIGALAATSASNRTEVTSPDGRLAAWVEPTPKQVVDTALGDAEATELWIRSTVDGSRRMLVRGHSASNPKEAIAEVSNLHFSHDGRIIYFDSIAWVTSTAVHAVNIESGKVWFIADGSTFEVIHYGAGAGNLLIDRALIKTNAKGESTGRGFYRWVYTKDGFAVAELGPIDG